ncbi:hypothetical protein BJV77DRAFT_575990 [Russula vinacea]|nr:hypothetical protein BJV77DRAFT_575990 [Russula vinacea]
MLDIKLIVRFEVDTCLPTDANTAKTGTSDKKPSVKKVPELALDDLVDALGDMNLTSSSTTTTTSLSSLNIIRAGTQVPQESLLEVTSRSKYFIDQLNGTSSTHNSRSHKRQDCVSVCTSTAHSPRCMNARSTTKMVRMWACLRASRSRGAIRQPSLCGLRAC